MLHTEYKEALQLSRSFHNRTKEKSERLYLYIATAVKEAQDPSLPTSMKSVDFLVKLYEPFIKNTSYKYFSTLKKQLEFQDAFQETVEVFLKLLYKYKSDLASFSYYIYRFLPQYMKIRVTHELRLQQLPIDNVMMEALLTAGTEHNCFDQFDFFDIPLLEKEYVAFIQKRSLKESKSGTMKEVCNSFFLGNKTCAEIAEERNISYHAVYEIINKIKVELADFLRASRYYDNDSTVMLLGGDKNVVQTNNTKTS